jgi:phospholipid/cholesterol/gamma-HCH transport system substrate-binding protein
MSLRPSPAALPWMSLRIGLFAAAVLVALGALVIRLGTRGTLFGSTSTLFVQVSDGIGLRAGGQVTLLGQPAGVIRAVRIVPARTASAPSVVVETAINADAFAALRADGDARVRALGLLGDRVLDLVPGTVGAGARRAGDTLRAVAFTDLATLFSIADSALREVSAVSVDLRGVTRTLTQGNGSMRRLLTDGAVHDSLVRTLARADRVMAQLLNGRGTLGRLMQDTSVYGSVRSAAISLDSAAQLINQRDATLARLQRDTQLVARLSRSAASVDTLVRRLNAGVGTAGQLLQERELYDRLLRATAALDSLATDLKRNPSRYTRGAVKLF